MFNFDKYKNYKEKTIFLLKNGLLPISFSYSLEEETNVTEVLYSPEEAIKVAKERSDDKLKSQLKKEEKIISSKILSTNEQENYVSVTIFYKVLEDITSSAEIKVENEKNSNNN